MSGLVTLDRETRPTAADLMPPESIAEMQLEIFTSVPARHIVFAVDDDSCMPLAARGQVLVIEDAPHHYPIKNQWFLMQWIRPESDTPYSQGRRVGQTIGIPYENRHGRWGYRPPCQRGQGVTYCGDGWWDFDRMVNLIRGPVVGIYAPGGMQ